MLKLSGAMCETAVWRLGVRRFASATGAVPARVDKSEPVSTATASISDEQVVPDEADIGKTTGLVAAAFASLISAEEDEKPKNLMPSPKSFKVNKFQQIDALISRSTDLNTLLSVAENTVVSRKHALKIVSMLSEWSNSRKVKIEEFETDARFLRLCRVLARSRDAAAVSTMSNMDDLSTVLSVTGDDEAARLVADLSLPQMIKVMSALATRGRRSTPLLRSLAHHVTAQTHTLNMKQAADLLFCMATLNFPDPPLMEKVCNDIISSLPRTELPAGVHSALVSLGLLRYRSPLTLDALCRWITSSAQTRPQDVQAALLTVATLAYSPDTADQLVEMALQLKREVLPKPQMWLDVVWSLLLLERAPPRSLLVSALDPQYIESLYVAGELPMSVRRKLQLVRACSTLAAEPGAPPAPKLPDDVTAGSAPTYSREKAFYVQSVVDTLRSLIASEQFLRTECNSGMGFLYDAEFAVDTKCHPVPLVKAEMDRSVTRIAVLAWDYHDFCRKSVEPLGVTLLYRRLLRLKGYKVLTVPFTEYSPRDTLVCRVQYLERRLRELAASS